VAISQSVRPASDSRHVHVRTENGSVHIEHLIINELKSVWN